MDKNIVMKIGIKAFSVMLFVVLLTTAHAVATTVSLADVVLELDDDVILPIMMSDITDYSEGTVNILYDPSIVHVTSVTDSSDSSVVSKNINNATGHVRLLASNLNGVSGDIAFANVEFMAVGPGTTPLTIDVIELCDTSYDDISANISDGSITVPQPPKPFFICGNISYKNGTLCNNPTVSITNLNNGRKWMAGTSGSYYQISLMSGIDLNASEVLRFDVTDGVYFSITDHTVTDDEVDDGGLSNHNLTLGPVPGDVNGDGNLTTADAAIVLRMAVSGEYSEVADVSRDDIVTSLDALMILQAVSQEG